MLILFTEIESKTPVLHAIISFMAIVETEFLKIPVPEVSETTLKLSRSTFEISILFVTIVPTFIVLKLPIFPVKLFTKILENVPVEAYIDIPVILDILELTNVELLLAIFVVNKEFTTPVLE